MGNSKSLYSKQEYLYYYIERKDTPNISKWIQTNPELVNSPITKDTKQTALMRVSYNGNLELAKLLVSFKADVNYVTPKGQTALTSAVKRGHFELTQYLIESGADITHVSKNGLRVIQYAILPGFYQICKLIYEKLSTEEKQTNIQDPLEYQKIGKKHAFRYVNYQQFLQGLVLGKVPEQMPNYLKKNKAKLVDPVVDPRETWKQWFKRQLQWKDAPLVERSSLPQNLQPQNRILGKAHHFTNNFMSTHMSQKTILKPIDKLQYSSQMGDLHSKIGEGATEQKFKNNQVQSQI